MYDNINLGLQVRIPLLGQTELWIRQISSVGEYAIPPKKLDATLR